MADRESMQSISIALPPTAKPGMNFQVKLPNGQVVQVAVPSGYKPGQKLKLNIRTHNTAHVGAHPGRHLPRHDTTGEFQHRIALQEARQRQAVPAHHEPGNHAKNMQTELQRSYNAAMGRRGNNPCVDYFQDWSKYQMVEALIARGTVIKGEQNATHRNLVLACASEFSTEIQGGVFPPKPVEDHNLFTVATKMIAARRIQRMWSAHMHERNHARMMERAMQDTRIAKGGYHDNGDDTFGSYKKENEHHYHPKARGPEAAEAGTADSHKHLDKHLEAEWVKPSIDKARQFQLLNSPKKDLVNTTWCGSNTGRHCVHGGCGEQLDYWDEGQVSEYSQFGPGIVLYFKFIKWMYWVLGICSLLYLPMMIINSHGDGIADPSLLNSLALTTVGNLGHPSNNTRLTLPGCRAYNYILDTWFEDSSECVLKKQEVGILYTLIDAVVVVFLVIAIIWLREFEETEVSYLDANTVMPSDFTVYLPYIPPKIQVHKREAELRELREEILFLKSRKGRKPGTEDYKACQTAMAQIAVIEDKQEFIHRPTTESDVRAFFEHAATTTETFDMKDKKVVDVNFGFDNGDLIDKFKARGKRMFDHYKIGHQIRYWRSRSRAKNIDTANPPCCAKWCSKEYSDAKEEHLLKKRDDIKKEMDKLDRETASQRDTWQPLVAFVSFDTEEDYEAALREHRFSAMKKFFHHVGCGGLCCVKPSEIFGGHSLLRARPAPSPSTIVWEHMKHGPVDRFKRRLNTTMICLLMIVGSITITAVAEKVKFTAKLDTPEECPLEFESWDVDKQKAYVTDDEGDITDMVHCYCNTLESIDQAADKLCQEFYKNTILSFLLQGFAVMTVLGANMFITIRINKLAKSYEKHHSMDGEESSVFYRTFVLKFINTGCLYLIINFTLVKQIIGDTGIDEEWSVSWYAKVAPLLITTMLINVGAPHGPVFMRWYLHRRKIQRVVGELEETTLTLEDCEKYEVGHGHPLINRRIQDKTKGSAHVTGKIIGVKDGRCALEWSDKDTVSKPRSLTFAEVLPLLVEVSGVQDIEDAQKTDKIYCQDELNKKFMGPDFHLHLRYAQQMVNFYVCMMYSMGIPILVPIVCVSSLVTFWFDKYMFQNFYKTPPNFSHAISFSASELLIFGVILHLLCGVAMFSNDLIFTSKTFATEGAVAEYTADYEDETVYQKVTQNHVVVLTILLLCVTALVLVKILLGKSFKLTVVVYKFLCCKAGAAADASKSTNATAVSYSNALRRGLIRGLPSYNVLLNPVYREAFRIDLNFAGKHRHVDSVLNYDMETRAEKRATGHNERKENMQIRGDAAQGIRNPISTPPSPAVHKSAAPPPVKQAVGIEIHEKM